MDPEKTALIVEDALPPQHEVLDHSERRQQKRRRFVRALLFAGAALNLLLFASLAIGHSSNHHYSKIPAIGDWVQGHVPFGSWTCSGRRTVIDSPTHSIDGTYNLYDLLSLRSGSGSISVSVKPQPADPSAPNKPAVFSAWSGSGSIDVDFVAFPDTIPPRQYRTFVTSHSGSISGSYLLGAETEIKSQSGSLEGITLQPVVPESSEDGNAKSVMHLFTSSKSGSHGIRILSPSRPFAADDRNTSVSTGIQAHHSSYSGAQHIEYPAEWEGELVLKSRSGSLNVVGDGVTIIKDEHGIVGRTLVARKGDAGKGRIVCTSASGSIDVQIG